MARLLTPWALQQHFGILASEVYILMNKPTAAPGTVLGLGTTSAAAEYRYLGLCI